MPSTSIQVLDRAVSLLEALERYPDPVALKVLAAEAGLHASTAFRILAALTTHGFVERLPGGQYTLGRRLLQLGSRLQPSLDLRQEARPVMERLRDDLGESINLTVREGDEVVYVEKATPKRMMHVQQVIGSRAPLHVTAVGKMMLAEGGDEECRGYAARTNLPAFTRNTINRLEALLAEAARIRARGYALDDEEAEIGVGCIGCVIRDWSASIVGGLSVSAPIERRRDDWIATVVEAAAELSARLGHRR
jgi:DNA-binding IclR family transcriptional regulator